MELNEEFSGKVYAAIFGLAFFLVGMERLFDTLRYFFSSTYQYRLYETNNIYAEFGAVAYTVCNLLAVVFFAGIGVAFWYFGLVRKYEY